MAEGLSNVPLSGNSGQPSFKSLSDKFVGGAPTPRQSPSPSGTSLQSPPPAAGAVLDFGGAAVPLEGSLSPGEFQVTPEGTYRFGQSRTSASLDFLLSQTTARVEGGADGNTLASLTELNIALSASAEFEEVVLEIGRERSGQAAADFGQAINAVIDRFVGRQISATINFSLSFSQVEVGFNSNGEVFGDLGQLESTGNLGGFVTLLEAFFGNAGTFADFLNNLEAFVQGLQVPSTSENTPAINASPSDETLEGSVPAVSVTNTQVRVEVNLSIERTSVQFSSNGGPAATDPIVLDLDGDGIELTSAREGVRFDLDGDGRREQTATVTGGDGFLALDRNANGRVDDGRELFGDQRGAANGFEELRLLDSNSDGRIDSGDPRFEDLRVFVDKNQDGVSQRGELRTLAEANISSIDLGYRNVSEAASGGNRIAQRSVFTRTDGTTGIAADALLDRLV